MSRVIFCCMNSTMLQTDQYVIFSFWGECVCIVCTAYAVKLIVLYTFFAFRIYTL